MSAKISFLAIAFAIVPPLWLPWRIDIARWVAPLAVAREIGLLMSSIGQIALALAALNDAAV